MRTGTAVAYTASATSQPRHPWWKRRGWRYHPFQHLDAARDPHLLEYLVAPPVSEVPLLEDQPVLVVAPPGGGKTAFRRYVERHALQRSGLVAPVLLIPSHHPTSLQEAERLAVQALAWRIFWQAIYHYRTFQWHTDPALRTALGALWRQYLHPIRDLRILAQWVGHGNWEPLERFGGLAYQPRPGLDTRRALQEILQDMAQQDASSPELSLPEAWKEGLTLLAALGAQRVWLLLDGLDGFPESATLSDLWAVWYPLLARWLHLAQARVPIPVVLKAFLPLTRDGETVLQRHDHWPWVRLVWERPQDLMKVVQTRVSAASNGMMDSLDALVAAELRPFEPRLLETIPQEQRLPRTVIERAGEVLACLEENDFDYLTGESWHRLRKRWRP